MAEQSQEGRAIFVSNFGSATTARDITVLFQRYGAVSRLDMKRGFCFVFMADDEAGKAALKNLHDSEYLTGGGPRDRLTVQWARGDGAIKRREDARRRAHIVPNDTLFVVNFDPTTTGEHDLRLLFQEFGSIVRVDLNERFAFVQYDSIEAATSALAKTNGHMLKDRRLIVEYTTRNTRGGSRKRERSWSPGRARRDGRGYGGYGGRAEHGDGQDGWMRRSPKRSYRPVDFGRHTAPHGYRDLDAHPRDEDGEYGGGRGRDEEDRGRPPRHRDWDHDHGLDPRDRARDWSCRDGGRMHDSERMHDVDRTRDDEYGRRREVKRPARTVDNWQSEQRDRVPSRGPRTRDRGHDEYWDGGRGPASRDLHQDRPSHEEYRARERERPRGGYSLDDGYGSRDRASEDSPKPTRPGNGRHHNDSDGEDADGGNRAEEMREQEDEVMRPRESSDRVDDGNDRARRNEELRTPPESPAMQKEDPQIDDTVAGEDGASGQEGFGSGNEDATGGGYNTDSSVGRNASENSGKFHDQTVADGAESEEEQLENGSQCDSDDSEGEKEDAHESQSVEVDSADDRDSDGHRDSAVEYGDDRSVRDDESDDAEERGRGNEYAVVGGAAGEIGEEEVESTGREDVDRDGSPRSPAD